MSLWGNLDAANNAPVFGPTGGLGMTANTQQLYGNTTIATTSSSLGRAGMAIGVFGVDTAEMANTVSKANTSGAHAGWVLRKEGTGGRAGRVHVETLVAMGSIYGDADETGAGDGGEDATLEP
jgi:hypothetical protein